MEKKTIQFIKEKETKGTIRFAEVEVEGQPPVIGTLYVKKYVAKEATKATIELTLE